MTEEKPDYAAMAKTDFERNRDFWKGRCQYCKSLVEIIKEEMGCTHSEALMLYAAMSTDNAANLVSNAIHVWKQQMERMQPAAETLAKAAEEQMRSDKPPWEGEAPQ